MVSQYSHYKMEQGELLGQKHKADYSTGPQIQTAEVAGEGLLTPDVRGEGKRNAMFSCNLCFPVLELSFFTVAQCL